MAWWNPLGGLDAKVDRVLSLLRSLTAMANTTDAAITKLQADVAALTTAEQAAAALLQGLKQQLDAALAAAQNAGATPAQLQALSDLSASIEAQTAGLAQAVAANTPPAPAAP